MHFRVRDLDPDGKFAPQLKMELLARVLPRAEVQAVFQALGLRTQRVRKLSLEGLLWLVIGMNLFPDLALSDVWEELTHGLRLLWPHDAERLALLPQKRALSYRRYQLGVRPLRQLFHRTCRPLATPQTRGAFLGGLRLMAIDGHTEDVPDTPENAAVFGRPTTDRGASAFPQVRCVSLCECGTHALVDTSFWPLKVGEDRGAHRLLRSVTPEMLVLVEAGLHSYDLLVGVRGRDAHALFRLPATVRPQYVRRLPDGSALVRLLPSDPKRRHRGEHALVRLLEYHFDDPQLAAHGKQYRLVTTLLDPEQFPAHTLACTYHERWEIELTMDEQDTHQLQQHQPASPLRSRKPAGVIQELYGLFLAHYAIRALMHAAAAAADADPERLRFTHALHVIPASISDFERAAPELHPGLYRRLLQDLARVLLPEREPRVAPRVVKRKVLKWPLQRLEHQRWPQPARPFWAAIVISGSHTGATI
jgi:hypothetical protein